MVRRRGQEGRNPLASLSTMVCGSVLLSTAMVTLVVSLTLPRCAPPVTKDEIEGVRVFHRSPAQADDMTAAVEQHDDHDHSRRRFGPGGHDAVVGERKVRRPCQVAYAVYLASATYKCGVIVVLQSILNTAPRRDAHLVIVCSNETRHDAADVFRHLREADGRALQRPVLLFVAPLSYRVCGVTTNSLYTHSLLKLATFELDEYCRIIQIDADGLVARSLDHLFDLPLSYVAFPHSHWFDKGGGTTAMMVITPERTPRDMLKAFLEQPERPTREQGKTYYDMDLMRMMFERDALLLPSFYLVLDCLLGGYRGRVVPYRPLEKVYVGSGELPFVYHFTCLQKPWQDVLELRQPKTRFQ